MHHEISAATILRVYYTRSVTGECGCCGTISRMGVVDLDRQRPICRACVPVSVQAAEALRTAGLFPPDDALIERNP